MEKLSKFLTIIGVFVVCFFVGYYLTVVIPENNKKSNEALNLIKKISDDVDKIGREVRDINPNKKGTFY